MVNVALQLSGRLRYTDESLLSLLTNIIHEYNPDIFCSFWNPIQTDTVVNLNRYLSNSDKHFIIELEDQRLITPYMNDIFHSLETYNNLPSMLYKFNRVNSMRTSYEIMTNKKYDVVIQARTDNIFFEKLKIPNNINGIYCSNNSFSAEIDPYISPRMVDNFYLGDPFNMNNAATTFWKLKSQLIEYKQLNQFHQMKIPEIIQSKIWNDMNIPIHSLHGNNPFGNFWYDIDRQETPWK